LVLQTMVDNEQDQPPTAGVGSHGKILWHLKSNLILICTAIALRHGSRDRAGPNSDTRWFETALRLGQSVDKGIKALTRKPEPFLSSESLEDFTSAILIAIRSSHSGT